MVEWSIGIDIAEVDRFRNLDLQKNEYFFSRILNNDELNYCTNFEDPYPHIAGIFAAKEAILKALKIFTSISLLMINIFHDKEGKPIFNLKFSDKDEDFKKRIIAEQIKNLKVEVTITHTKKLALAWSLVSNLSYGNLLYRDWETINKEILQGIENGFRIREDNPESE